MFICILYRPYLWIIIFTFKIYIILKVKFGFIKNNYLRSLEKYKLHYIYDPNQIIQTFVCIYDHKQSLESGRSKKCIIYTMLLA